MKKIIYILIIITQQLYAQQNAYLDVHYYRNQSNIITNGGSSDVVRSIKDRFNIGINVNIPIAKKWCFHTGIQYWNGISSYEKTLYSEEDILTGGAGSRLINQSNVSVISIPVGVSYPLGSFRKVTCRLSASIMGNAVANISVMNTRLVKSDGTIIEQSLRPWENPKAYASVRLALPLSWQINEHFALNIEPLIQQSLTKEGVYHDRKILRRFMYGVGIGIQYHL